MSDFTAPDPAPPPWQRVDIHEQHVELHAWLRVCRDESHYSEQVSRAFWERLANEPELRADYIRRFRERLDWRIAEMRYGPL
ncbi:hypothetical protein ACFY9F_36530 [Streptomyces sp. NPDC012421]|uniref:hypothetical protein n=1 Tax=Streptomyces sp. NPDC012421 TaxID=3364832 RepID=UPI0036E7BF4C